MTWTNLWFLGEANNAPNPVEYLAAGLCGCITAGIATNAELFGVSLEKLEVQVDIDFDLIGLLAVDRSVRTTGTGIRYIVRLKGKDGVTQEQLERCKAVIDNNRQCATRLRTPFLFKPMW